MGKVRRTFVGIALAAGTAFAQPALGASGSFTLEGTLVGQPLAGHTFSITVTANPFTPEPGHPGANLYRASSISVSLDGIAAPYYFQGGNYDRYVDFSTGLSGSGIGFGDFLGMGLILGVEYDGTTSLAPTSNFSTLSPYLFFDGDANDEFAYLLPDYIEIGPGNFSKGMFSATIINDPPPRVGGAVPEPASWGMMLLGLGATGFATRRRAKVRANISFA